MRKFIRFLGVVGVLSSLPFAAAAIKTPCQPGCGSATGTQKPPKSQTAQDSVPSSQTSGTPSIAPGNAQCSCTIGCGSSPATRTKDKPPSGESGRSPVILGGFSGSLAPGQQAVLVLKNFDPDKQALWLVSQPRDASAFPKLAKEDVHVRVDPSSFGKAGEHGEVEFTVPAELADQVADGKEFSAEAVIRGIDEGPPPRDYTGGGAKITLRALQWWQSWIAAVVLNSLIVVGMAIVLVRMGLSGGKASLHPVTGPGQQAAGALAGTGKPPAYELRSYAIRSASTRARYQWLVDAQTNSYSLQRIQFLAWTIAAVFAYFYIFYSLYLVQDKHTFPQLPAGLVKLLGISAGTSILATVVRFVKGPEGAGGSDPSLRDLITTGDVVALDKVQLVVWTVVGLVSFLGAVLSRAPLYVTSKMEDLPEALLGLAGLSGAIYVAGKIARDPGPVISQLIAKPIDSENGVRNGVSFELRGMNLSQDAVFSIGGEKISFEQLGGVPSPGGSQYGLPKVTVPGDTATTRLVRGLSFEIRPPSGESAAANAIKAGLAAGSHVLTIENPDGQKAQCPYTL